MDSFDEFPCPDESGVVDFYLENYEESLSQAQYDAWQASEVPFDFTGSSYLEEYTRPLRESSELATGFHRRVETSRETCSEFKLWPTLDADKLQFILDIDEAVFQDGDHFLLWDSAFLDDPRKVELCAAGVELARISMTSGCWDFWQRLRVMGPTPRMVREANHWLLYRQRDEVTENDLKDALLTYVPSVAKKVDEGGEVLDALGDEIADRDNPSEGWMVSGALDRLTKWELRELLREFLCGNESGVDGFLNRSSGMAEREARKRNQRMYLRVETKRVDDFHLLEHHPCDLSVLQITTSWQQVASYAEAPVKQRRMSIRLGAFRVRARARCSHGQGPRRRSAGSRRSSSGSDPGDGGGGSDPPARRRLGPAQPVPHGGPHTRAVAA